ncbi:ANTAR domain-containing protein [Streptomyces longispororuber]|uniref:ANTAR domain-containing protein n=1 Tax=Streptomyces longispororuber TaxID=68230 RepID=UPI00210CDA05|nr:ANTAR domain-containing protein [Streptomyces longispororuber]MCQ4205586.1 ANTAR domain-containing protein [Streptomyces longispororuber]
MTSNAEQPSELAAHLEAAEDRVDELLGEVHQLKHAVASHADVDQAIGVVLAVGQLTPAEAWDVLRETSMHTNTKLRRLAELVVEWGRGAELPADIRTELDRQLRARQAASE